jgi:exodeoxyribonuclease VII large subunit
MDCDILADRAVKAMRRITERRAGELQAVAASLQALSPLQVLSRGYSLTLKNDGTILRTGSSLEIGDVLQTRLLASTVTSTVTGVAEL